MPPEQPVYPVTPQTLSPAPKPSNKLFWILVLILLIIGGVSAYGLYFYRPAENIQLIRDTSTSDWQTYRNEEMRIEFKYPASWELISGNGEVELYAPESQGLNGPFASADILIATATMTAGTLEGYVATYRDNWYSDYSCHHAVGSGPETIRCTSQFLTIPRLPALAGFVRMDNERLALVVGTNSSADTFNAVLRSIRPISSSPPVIESPVACTMDAMMCPDGSYVGRSGPNCQFICP